MHMKKIILAKDLKFGHLPDTNAVNNKIIIKKVCNCSKFWKIPFNFVQRYQQMYHSGSSRK